MAITPMVDSEERYSSSVKRMTQVTKSFSKDGEEMEALLSRLSKNKYEIELDISKAEKELRALEEQYLSVGKADQKMLSDKQSSLEAMRRNQQLVNQELKKAEDYMRGTTGDSLFGILQKSEVLQMPTQILQRGTNNWVSSTWGAKEGKLFSNILSSTISGATSGATIGSLIPGLGTAVGAAIGAGSGVVFGAINGGLEIFEGEDDAFKTHVKGQVETQLAQRDSEAILGSAYAAQRERGMAEALARMETEGVTAELLRAFDGWGLDGAGVLAERYGMGRGELNDRLSAGELDGADAAEALRQALERAFPHAMLEPDKTFESQSALLKNAEQALEGSIGWAYNQAALTGLRADTEAYQGPLGEELKAMNSMIGEGRGMAENLERQYQREAMSLLATGEGGELYEGRNADRLGDMHREYAALKEEFDSADEARKAEIGAQIEALKSEAEALAADAYNASETGIALRDTQLDLIEAIRKNTFALGGAAWNREYLIQQEESKGLLAGKQGIALENWAKTHSETEYDPAPTAPAGNAGRLPASSYLTGGYAYGLERVPYDNFPALLHEGERVLTASQARAEDRGGGTVSVQIGQVSFGETAADPEAAAEVFARALERELLLAGAG